MNNKRFIIEVALKNKEEMSNINLSSLHCLHLPEGMENPDSTLVGHGRILALFSDALLSSA